MALTNIGIYKNWIVYQAKDNICELWRNRGKSSVQRIVTTAKDYAEAVIWIDGMGKPKKEKQQKKNSRSIDLSEYDDPGQTRIE